MGLQEAKISMGHARAIINVPSIDNQLAIYKDIIDQDLSVRQTEEIARNIDDEPYDISKIKKSETILPHKYQKLKEQISKYLGLKTDLKRNNKGKGTLVVHFKSDNDLEHIISKIRK